MRALCRSTSDPGISHACCVLTPLKDYTSNFKAPVTKYRNHTGELFEAKATISIVPLLKQHISGSKLAGIYAGRASRVKRQI